MQRTTPSVLAAITPLSAQNSGGVVTLLGASTQICSINLGLCVPGQLILATAQAPCVKGGVAGDTNVGIVQASGTGTISFFDSLGIPNTQVPAIGAGALWQPSLAAIGRVTAGGTIVLDFVGASVGSNSTIAQNAGRFAVFKFNR